MILVEKNFLYELPKGTCDFECQAQVGMIPGLLDRVDRLARHSHHYGEFRLGPLALRTQHAQSSLNRSHRLSLSRVMLTTQSVSDKNWGPIEPTGVQNGPFLYWIQLA